MTIYDTIMDARKVEGADRALLSLLAGEICTDGKPMDNAKAIVRLSQMKKTCDKNIELYKSVQNFGEALKEVVFLNLITSFLPAGAKKKDVEQAIAQLAVEPSMKSMGIVMGYLKNKFEVVDGNLVKSVLLGGS